MNFNISLPSLSDTLDKQNAEKIKGYLATLHDQLRYMMLNIDTENLSDELATTIKNSSEYAKEAKESIFMFGEKLSKITQTTDKINFILEDGSESTSFTLTSKAADLIAESLNIKSKVTFSDLENQGSTVINGNNIISGSISADKLSVGDLSALSATIGGWNVSQNSISSSSSGQGSISLNSASSADSYWIKAQNANGYTTFYIAKNGACYFDGSYISNGTITASKIVTDTGSRIDLSNNGNGLKIGKEIWLASSSGNGRIFVNPQGIMSFDTGSGNTTFSFALNRDGSNYTLSVLNGSGITVGTINL